MTPASTLRSALLALALNLAGPALAQVASPPSPPAATDCILDKCADKGTTREGPLPTAPRRSGPPFSATAPGNFDFYVLSLSWSSGFCETGGAAKAQTQCAAGANLGFVVHGLWPQFERGFPSDCADSARVPSRIALDSARGLFPDDGLARYEWRKHGTCSGKSPTDYFADVRRARDAIVIPPAFRAPRDAQNWAPPDIARAFMSVNPTLRYESIATACKAGVLQEVRLCFDKDLRGFHACPEVTRATCRARQVSVPPPL